MTDLFYRRHGRGRPLVLVHGATLDHRMWYPQDALADRCELIAVDLRGYGSSPPPTGPFKHCEDLAGLLDDLDLTEVCVVGHSIGALYALELALLRPDRVTALVSVCMSGLTQDYPDDVQAMFAELKRLARADRMADAKALWASCGWFTQAREHPALATLLDRYLADYAGWYWLHDSPAQNLVPPADTRLEQLAIPTLVIDGELDLAYNHRIARRLATRIPGAELLRLSGIGHMASLEAADRVTSAIGQHVSR